MYLNKNLQSTVSKYCTWCFWSFSQVKIGGRHSKNRWPTGWIPVNLTGSVDQWRSRF